MDRSDVGSRHRMWQIKETAALLKSWKDHVRLFRCLKKYTYNNPFSDVISKDLQKYGIKRSATQIRRKMKNIRHKKMLLAPSWRKEIEEIEKIEKSELDQRSAPGSQTETTSMLICGPHVEGNVPESSEAFTANVADNENDSGPDLLTHTAKRHAKSKICNNIQMSFPQLCGSNSKKSSETILLNICKEFRESNRQLEANDIAILKLFTEQNDIFRKQTKLLEELL